MKFTEYLMRILTSLPYAFIIFLLVGSILAPYLEHKRMEVSQVIYAILGNWCHQMPTRCFWIFGSPMGLCARCFSFYSSLLATGFFLLYKNTKKIFWKWGFLLLIPILIDGTCQLIGLWASTNLIRAVTGLAGGIGIGLLVFPIYFRFIHFFEELRKARNIKRFTFFSSKLRQS